MVVARIQRKTVPLVSPAVTVSPTLKGFSNCQGIPAELQPRQQIGFVVFQQLSHNSGGKSQGSCNAYRHCHPLDHQRQFGQ
jgi:hypothetical protein